jgi:hypothetical protein
MLVPKRSLLNREYMLINVLKALASIIYMCNHRVILLSKITVRYFTVCPQGCSLGMAIILLPVYAAITLQWVCMSQYEVSCVGKLTLEGPCCQSPDLGGSEIEDYCRAWYLSCGDREREHFSSLPAFISIICKHPYPFDNICQYVSIIILLLSLGRAVQAFSCGLKSRASIHGFPEVSYLFLHTSIEERDDFLQPMHILKIFLTWFFSDKLLLQLCLYI